ncbi:MAG: hypothetical protein ABI663_14625 [Chryseolinea sp.]
MTIMVFQASLHPSGSSWFLLSIFTVALINQVLALITGGTGYSHSILRDLNKNEVAIRELIERIWYDDDETERE